MVPRKGPDEYSINRLAQDIRGLGHNKVILKVFKNQPYRRLRTQSRPPLELRWCPKNLQWESLKVTAGWDEQSGR